MADYRIIMISVIVLFTIFQLFLAKRSRWWEGYIIPAVYFIFNTHKIWAALAASEVRLKPDFFEAGVLLFIGIWFLMIYFIFYYYWLCRKGDKREKEL